MISFVILSIALYVAAAASPVDDLREALQKDPLDPAKIEAILNANQDLVNAPVIAGQTPLTYICQSPGYQSRYLAEYLLNRAEADINAGNKDTNPLAMAVMVQLDPDLVQFLLRHNPNPDVVWNAFDLASRRANHDVFNAVLDHVLQYDDKAKLKDALMDAYLAAATQSYLSRMKRLVLEGHVEIDAVLEADGSNAAHLIARKHMDRLYEPLAWLASQNPDMMKAVNNANQSPMDLLRQSITCTKPFMKYIKDVTNGVRVPNKTDEMKRLLEHEDVNPNAIKDLLESDPTIAFTELDQDGSNALMFVAKIKSNSVLKVAQILIENGADVNYMTSDGRTVFGIAAKAENIALMHYLLDNCKIDVLVICRTVFDCIGSNYPKAFDVIVDYMEREVRVHFDRDWDGKTAFLLAASKGNRQFLKRLYKTGLVNANYADKDLDNAAHLAAKSDDPTKAILWLWRNVPELFTNKNLDEKTPIDILQSNPRLSWFKRLKFSALDIM